MPDDKLTIHIDWEQQRENPEQVQVRYRSTDVSGVAAFSADSIGKTKQESKVVTRGDKETTELVDVPLTEKEQGLADAQTQLHSDIAPLVDALKAVEMPVPTFKGKPVGEAPKLYRVLVDETTVKAVVGGQIVDVPEFKVVALWGDPGNPIRHELSGGGDLAEILEMAVTTARELAETHIGG
jgi:hypothetical protein